MATTATTPTEMGDATYLQRVTLECSHLKLVEQVYGSPIRPLCVGDWENCYVCDTHPTRQVVKVEIVDYRETQESWDRDQKQLRAMLERNKK